LLLEGVFLLNGMELLRGGLVILKLLVFSGHAILVERLREWLLYLGHVELVWVNLVPIVLQLLALGVLAGVHHVAHVVESERRQHLLVV